MTRLSRMLVLLAVIALSACQGQTADTTNALEPFAEGGGTCAGEHLDPGASFSGDWGSATGVARGVEYTVEAGWTVTICAKGGPANNTVTIEGPATGTVSTPPNPGGNPPDLSHWSVVDIVGANGPPTTEPAPGSTTPGSTTPDSTTPTSTTPAPTVPPDTAIPGTSIAPSDTTTPDTTVPPDTTTPDATAPSDTTTPPPTNDTTLPTDTTPTMTDSTTTTAAGSGASTTTDPPTTTTVEPANTTTTVAPVAGGSTTSVPGTDDELPVTGPSGPFEPGHVAIGALVTLMLGGGLVAASRRRRA